MKNIALTLSYCGTNYHGWQRQDGLSTVQGTLEHALERHTGAHIPLSGCGRTDAGVHARTYCANFKSDTNIPLDKLPLAINAIIPKDIVVCKAHLVPAEFDARFSCLAKEYTYQFYNDTFPSPFEAHRSFHIIKPLDVAAMQAAAAYFVGRQDFAAVKNEGTPVSSTVREIYYCTVYQSGNHVCLAVCADGFLYNMVRNIAGCLWYVGCGKLTPTDIPRILQSKDRCQAGPTAPAQGLYMSRTFYDPKEQVQWTKP